MNTIQKKNVIFMNEGRFNTHRNKPKEKGGKFTFELQRKHKLIIAYVIVSLFLTAVFANIAYSDRGYIAFGSEYFLVFLMPLGVNFIIDCFSNEERKVVCRARVNANKSEKIIYMNKRQDRLLKSS